MPYKHDKFRGSGIYNREGVKLSGSQSDDLVDLVVVLTGGYFIGDQEAYAEKYGRFSAKGIYDASGKLVCSCDPEELKKIILLEAPEYTQISYQNDYDSNFHTH